MPDAPDVSPGKLVMGHVLRLGSGLLGCAAFLDLAREAVSGGSWRATAVLGHCYGAVVGAYAFTHEVDKWQGQAPDVPRKGHLFFYAWLTLPALIWLTQLLNWRVVWPDSLNATLFYVFGAYGATRLSKGLRTLDAARQRAAAPAPETPQQYWARHALRFGSMLLGAVCLLDCALEGFTAGEWHFLGSIYATYYFVLGAYASTREWDKWTDRYDQDASWGHWFVAAWIVLAVALGAAKLLGYMVVMPTSLYTSLATTVGVWLGIKGIAAQRPAAGSNWWGIPAPQPAPAPTKGSPAGDEPQRPGKSASDQEAEERARRRAAVIEACKARGIFTTLEIAQDTGIDQHKVAANIGWLCNEGLVRKLDEERYQWIGGRDEKVVYK